MSPDEVRLQVLQGLQETLDGLYPLAEDIIQQDAGGERLELARIKLKVCTRNSANRGSPSNSPLHLAAIAGAAAAHLQHELLGGLGHLVQPGGAEGALRVQVDGAAGEAAEKGGHLNGDAELQAELALADAADAANLLRKMDCMGTTWRRRVMVTVPPRMDPRGTPGPPRTRSRSSL